MNYFGSPGEARECVESHSSMASLSEVLLMGWKLINVIDRLPRQTGLAYCSRAHSRWPSFATARYWSGPPGDLALLIPRCAYSLLIQWKRLEATQFFSTWLASIGIWDGKRQLRDGDGDTMEVVARIQVCAIGLRVDGKTQSFTVASGWRVCFVQNTACDLLLYSRPCKYISDSKLNGYIPTPAENIYCSNAAQTLAVL